MEGSLMGQALSYCQYVLGSDTQFVGRIAAILKDQGHSKSGESAWTMALKYSGDVASQPNLAEAYQSALIASRPDPAAADDVITDAMLLTAVNTVMGAA